MTALSPACAPAKPVLWLSPDEADTARAIAWDRYANHPHADPNVGRSEYRAAIAAIDALANGEA